jgi:hypothetical protein
VWHTFSVEVSNKRVASGGFVTETGYDRWGNSKTTFTRPTKEELGPGGMQMLGGMESGARKCIVGGPYPFSPRKGVT